MRVFAAPFKGTAPNASVLLGVELRRPRSDARRRTARSSCRYMAVDAQGQDRAAARPTALTTEPAGPRPRRASSRPGFRMLNRMDLPPGRYQLRVAAHDSGGGDVGLGDLRPRRAGLREGAVQHERAGPDLARRRRDADGASRTSQLKDGAAGAADRARAASRRTTSSRSSPRSTTTQARRRTRSTSRPRCRPTTARCCSRPRRSATRASCRGRRAATATRRGFR